MLNTHHLQHSWEVLEVEIKAMDDLKTSIGKINESIESAQVQEEQKKDLREKLRVLQMQLDVKRRDVDARARQIANCCTTFEERCRRGISRLWNDCMIVVLYTISLIS